MVERCFNVNLVDDILILANQIYHGNFTKVNCLVGFEDLNFKISTEENLNFILKISSKDFDIIDMQEKIFTHLQNEPREFKFPNIIKTKKGKSHEIIIDNNGIQRYVWKLNWLEGVIYQQVTPITERIRYSIGQEVAKIDIALNECDHQFLHRYDPWDLAKAIDVKSKFHLFQQQDFKLEICNYFLKEYEDMSEKYSRLKKSTIHADPNNYNIILTDDQGDHKLVGLIDYGLAIHSQTINDLAICLAYLCQNVNDPIVAAIPIINGYNSLLPLEDDEIDCLYVLIAIRCIISVSAAAVNRKKHPDNKYLFVCEQPGWNLLKQLRKISRQFFTDTVRLACGKIL